MKRINFNELHIYRDLLADYRYFVITGVCEPVLVYIRYFLEKSFREKGARQVPHIDRGAYRRLGYDDEMIDEFEEALKSPSDYFEGSSLDNLYSLNIMNNTRLCEIDLRAAGTAGRMAFIDHVKTKNLDDSLLEIAPYGAYCIAYFDSVFDFMEDIDKKEIAQMRNIRMEMDRLAMSIENEDARNTGRTSRLLWIDASLWDASRRGMYSWALDLLSDKATKEFLWECTGACSELTMLRGFYNAVKLEAENYSRLGVGLTKKKMRETELYKSLLSVDGRAFGWDALRFYSDKKYKGVTLRSRVARSLQIEHAGLQNNSYRGSLGKCRSYLGNGKRYIEKLFKVRCLLECGSLSLSLGNDALHSKECRELCKKYGISMITTEDLRRAAAYDLFVYRDVLMIFNRESANTNRVLNEAFAMREIEEGEAPPVQPLLRVFLALGKHRKLVEKCS